MCCYFSYIQCNEGAVIVLVHVMLLLLLTTDVVAAQMKKPPRKSKEVETPTRQETSCQTEQSTVAGRHVYLIQLLPKKFLIFFSSSEILSSLLMIFQYFVLFCVFCPFPLIICQTLSNVCGHETSLYIISQI